MKKNEFIKEIKHLIELADKENRVDYTTIDYNVNTIIKEIEVITKINNISFISFKFPEYRNIEICDMLSITFKFYLKKSACILELGQYVQCVE